MNRLISITKLVWILTVVALLSWDIPYGAGVIEPEQGVENSANPKDSFADRGILITSLFGKTTNELIEILGAPHTLIESNGMMFGNAVWEFSDYFIETDFHPVTKPTINFLSFTSKDSSATMKSVLTDLKLDEFNGVPNTMWNGALRWQGYIAQATEFERVTWHPEDRSLAIKK